MSYYEIAHKARQSIKWASIESDKKMTYGKLNKMLNGPRPTSIGWNVNVITHQKLHDEMNSMFNKALIPNMIGVFVFVAASFAAGMWLGMGNDRLGLLIGGSAAAGVAIGALMVTAIGCYYAWKYGSHYYHTLTPEEKEALKNQYYAQLRKDVAALKNEGNDYLRQAREMNRLLGTGDSTDDTGSATHSDDNSGEDTKN